MLRREASQAISPLNELGVVITEELLYMVRGARRRTSDSRRINCHTPVNGKEEGRAFSGNHAPRFIVNVTILQKNQSRFIFVWSHYITELCPCHLC